MLYPDGREERPLLAKAGNVSCSKVTTYMSQEHLVVMGVPVYDFLADGLPSQFFPLELDASQSQMARSVGLLAMSAPQSSVGDNCNIRQGMHAAVIGSVWAVLLATLKLDPSWNANSTAAQKAKLWRRLPPSIPERAPTVQIEADVVED